MPDDQNTEPDSAPVLPDAEQAAPADGGESSVSETVDAPKDGGEGGLKVQPAKPDAPKEDPQATRRKLIDSLTGVANEKAPEEEAEPEAKDDTEPEKATAAAPEKKPEDAEPAHDDLAEVTNESVTKMKPGEARRKINKLISRVRAAEPFAALGNEIVQTCERHGFSAADYKAWMDIGIGMHLGDERAKAAFANLAKQAGIVAEPPAPAEVLTSDLNAWLDEQVKDLEMSPGVADALRDKLKTPAPAPRQAAPPPAAPRQPVQQIAPQRPWTPQDEQSAIGEIDTIMADFEKQIGADYKTIEPRIMAELSKRKGRHPHAWPDIVRSVIATERARLPQRKPVQTSVGASQGASSSAVPLKTERAKTIHRLTGQIPTE
jgi:hypothetical protein